MEGEGVMDRGGDDGDVGFRIFRSFLAGREKEVGGMHGWSFLEVGMACVGRTMGCIFMIPLVRFVVSIAKL